MVRVGGAQPAVYVAAHDEFYTTEWLRFAVRRYGGTVAATPHEADVGFVSLCDPESLGTLRRLRKQAPDLTIIVGGLQASPGNGIFLHWADAAVVGEGEGFIRTLCREGLEAALAMPCVVTASDPHREAVISDELNIDEAPVVRVSRRLCYALAARGCPFLCNFCFTGWAVPQLTANEQRLNAIARKARASGLRVTWITNDSAQLPAAMYAGTAQSTRVEQYLEHPGAYARSQMVRLGVEGIAWERRRWLGKRCTNDQIRAALDIAKARRQVVQLFFIVGFPEDQEEWPRFVEEAIPPDRDRNPRIWMKFTYFEPSPLTPLSTYDISRLRPFDAVRAWEQALSINRRARYYPPGGLTRALWRCMIGRARAELAPVIPGSVPRLEPAEFVDSMVEAGAETAIRPASEADLCGAHVHDPYRTARLRRAERLRKEEPG